MAVPITVTGQQMITRALQGLRVLGVGRTLTTPDKDKCLPYLQELIDSWQLERLSIYEVQRTSFTATADTQDFTIGPSGTIAITPKPIWIASASVIPSGDTIEQEVRIWKRWRWLNERNKALTDTIPRALYLDPNVTNSTLHLWPIQTTAPTVWLGLPVGLVGFADLSTVYTFPPGYHEAFRTELKVRLADEYGKPVTKRMEDAAKLAFGRIQRANDDGPPTLTVDPAIGNRGWYDIKSDETLN